jgi:hypothetical protein
MKKIQFLPASPSSAAMVDNLRDVELVTADERDGRSPDRATSGTITRKWN